MKKQVLVLLIAISLVLFGACSDGKNSSKNDGIKEQESSEEKADEESQQEDDNEESSPDKSEDKKEEDKQDKAEEDVEEENNNDEAYQINDFVDILSMEEVNKLDNVTISKDNMGIEIPQLKGDSELVKKINKEIIDSLQIFESSNIIISKISYEASILHGILNIKVQETGYMDMTCGGYSDKITIAINVDIRDGEIKKISNREIFKRLGVDKDIVKEFAKVYLSTYVGDDLLGQQKENYINFVFDSFDDAYNHNELFLYKTPYTNHFTLNFQNFEDEEHNKYDCELTLADNKLKMAMLSKPDKDVIGTCYIDYKNESKDIPSKNIFNKKTHLIELNPNKDGVKVYFTNFSKNPTFAEIYKFDTEEFKPYSEKITAKILKSSTKDIDNLDKGSIYLYRTDIPNTKAYECIALANDQYYGDTELIDGLKDDYKLQFIYKTVKCTEYYDIDTNKTVLNILDDGTFEVDKDYFRSKGLDISDGKYITIKAGYDSHLFLYPSDKINDASYAYHVFVFQENNMMSGLFYLCNSKGEKLDKSIELGLK